MGEGEMQKTINMETQDTTTTMLLQYFVDKFPVSEGKSLKNQVVISK